MFPDSMDSLAQQVAVDDLHTGSKLYMPSNTQLVNLVKITL